ncbi:MAG: hypothetical protein U0746_04765 [Gemmataceae bacterium]
MHFQFEVAQPTPEAPPPQGDGPPPLDTVADLLKQLLDVQREQLMLSRALTAAHDARERWRATMARMGDDFTGLPATCKSVLPLLERAYIDMVAELTEKLRDEEVDNEFALAEFLDRYGMRLNQLGTILNAVGPLAEVEPSNASG